MDHTKHDKAAALAADIQRASSALQQAVNAAREAGLRVDVGVDEWATVGSPNRFVLTVQVAVPL